MLSINGRNDASSPPITNGFTSSNKTTKSIINGDPARATMSAPQAIAPNPRRRQHRHIWMITGPAGCGKSTVAAFLAQELGLRYIEGDDYHPASNRQKMSQNIPLTDVDRWDWLISLRDAAVAALTDSPTQTGVVVTCSALKRKYRDVIRVAAYNDHAVLVHFLYLHASEEVLLSRVAARQGHYMGAGMVHSQFECLEAPDLREAKDVIACDCSGPLADVKDLVLSKVQEELQADFEGRHLDDGW